MLYSTPHPFFSRRQLEFVTGDCNMCVCTTTEHVSLCCCCCHSDVVLAVAVTAAVSYYTTQAMSSCENPFLFALHSCSLSLSLSLCPCKTLLRARPFWCWHCVQDLIKLEEERERDQQHFATRTTSSSQLSSALSSLSLSPLSSLSLYVYLLLHWGTFLPREKRTTQLCVPYHQNAPRGLSLLMQQLTAELSLSLSLVDFCCVRYV